MARAPNSLSIGMLKAKIHALPGLRSTALRPRPFKPVENHVRYCALWLSLDSQLELSLKSMDAGYGLVHDLAFRIHPLVRGCCRMAQLCSNLLDVVRAEK